MNQNNKSASLGKVVLLGIVVLVLGLGFMTYNKPVLHQGLPTDDTKVLEDLGSNMSLEFVDCDGECYFMPLYDLGPYYKMSLAHYFISGDTYAAWGSLETIAILKVLSVEVLEESLDSIYFESSSYKETRFMYKITAQLISTLYGKPLEETITYTIPSVYLDAQEYNKKMGEEVIDLEGILEGPRVDGVYIVPFSHSSEDGSLQVLNGIEMLLEIDDEGLIHTHSTDSPFNVYENQALEVFEKDVEFYSSDADFMSLDNPIGRRLIYSYKPAKEDKGTYLNLDFNVFVLENIDYELEPGKVEGDYYTKISYTFKSESKNIEIDTYHFGEKPTKKAVVGTEYLIVYWPEEIKVLYYSDMFELENGALTKLTFVGEEYEDVDKSMEVYLGMSVEEFTQEFNRNVELVDKYFK